MYHASVVRPTLLYISPEAVIPAKAGIQFRNTGFRVKPGMTIKVKGLLAQYPRFRACGRYGHVIFYDGKEIKMPIVQISLFPGRTPEKKEELIRNVTNAIADTLRIPKERVHIILNEVPKENIGHGGVPISKTDQ